MKVLTSYARMCNRTLRSNTKGLDYLRKRGLNTKMLLSKKYMVGYSRGDVDIKHLLKNYTQRQLKLGKLLTSSGSAYIPSDYIVFPFIKNNNTVGLYARAIDKNAEPQHINMPGKITNIYNIDNINLDVKKLYITEGIIDCLSLIHMGITNVIPTLGAFRKLPDVTPYIPRDTTIYIVFDRDDNGSGRNGAFKCAWDLYQQDYQNIFILTLIKIKNTKTDCNDILVKFSPSTETMFWNYVDKLEKYTLSTEFEQQLEATRRQKLQHMMESANYDYKQLAENIPIKFIIEQITNTMIPNTSMNIVCPLPNHTDTKPSLHIYEETNSWYCFGCNKGGGVIQFIKHYYQCTHQTAAHMLIKFMKKYTKGG